MVVGGGVVTVGARGGRWAVGAMALTVLVSCRDDPPEKTAEADAAIASPFAVDLDVDGYKAVTAGTGTEQQTWGSDSESTDEPFIALRRSGQEGPNGVVIVSVTGFEGQEGGLSQSARGSGDREQAFTLDGREAIYSPPGADALGPTWADLVAVVGEDLAVRVTAPAASREELVEWLGRVTTNGREEPPSVDVGDGVEVIGTVRADAAIASRASPSPNSDQVPGAETSVSVGWTDAPTGTRSLTLMALPGEAADLEALAVGQMVLGWHDPTVELGERGGRRDLIVEEDDSTYERHTRTIWMEAPNGDLLMARASGLELPSREELFTLLEDVRPTDEASWEALVIEATGGPGLHPDDGRVEIARGTVGELEWLMQTGPLQIPEVTEEGDVTEGEMGIDPCLKLSNRRRACGGGGGGSNFDWIYSVPKSDEAVPPYVILSTTLDAASVRVTTRTDQATAPLHQVPGEDLWGAVVFVHDPGLAVGMCADQPPSTVPDHEIVTMRVDALDEDGNVIGCLGGGLGSYEAGI